MKKRSAFCSGALVSFATLMSVALRQLSWAVVPLLLPTLRPARGAANGSAYGQRRRRVQDDPARS
jgi:hypothetical protein